MEEWKDVVGYEGLYEVSNLGRVRNKQTGKVLKPKMTHWGYYQLNLCNNGTRKTKTVHRLVAQAWIPQVEADKDQVNHINEIKTDNFVFVNADGTVDLKKSNLEWCNYQYNNTYNGRHLKAAITNRNNHLSDIIYQFTFDGEFVKEWESMHEIARVTGLKKAGITMATRGYCHSGERVIKLYGYRGYFWLKKKDFTRERLDELIEERREHYNREPWKDKYRNAR